MATEETPIPVRYWPKDDVVSLGGNSQIPSALPQQQPPQREAGKCAPTTILKIALPIIVALLFLAVPAITVGLVSHLDWLPSYRQENTELPDVTNLSLTELGTNYFTVSWIPPSVHFDYYWVESYVVGNSRDIPAPLHVGSCSNGTIIHRDQSRITCDNLKSCANVSITVHTKVKRGTGDAISTGAKVEGILIPGEEPDSPKNIKTVEASPELASIRWEAPSKVSGRIVGHSVSICHKFTSCNEYESLSNCTARDTSGTKLNLQFSGNSKLCVLVTSIAECGAHLLRSRPAAAEITRPTFVLPDVDNLTLLDIGPDHFTMSWVPPVAQFEYYWLEVYRGGDGSDAVTTHHIGSCANGTIVHRDQTQITCDMFKPCSNVSITLHTQAKGATKLTSAGATLQGIFMPGMGVPEVVNLAQTTITKNSVTVSWQRPTGCFDDYVVTASSDHAGFEGGQKLSAGMCGNAVTVTASQTSITCDNIEACSVSITVKTRRLRSAPLISKGVTLQGIILPKKDLDLRAENIGSSYAEITVDKSKPCADPHLSGTCKGQLRGLTSHKTEHFNCDCGRLKCTVPMTGLDALTFYNCTVALSDAARGVFARGQVSFLTRGLWE